MSTAAYCCRLHFLTLLLLVVTSSLHADDGNSPVYSVYSLSAEAEAEVSNDLMVVNLVVQAQGSDAAELANDVNANMSWALTRLMAYRSIDVETRDYQTRPRYEKKGSRIIGWNATQQLRLQTDNFEEAGKAVQLLQERLQVQGIQMSAKPATRKKAEDQLINEALGAFKQRALLVQTNMGAPDYKILDVNIHTGSSRTPAYERAQIRGAASSSAIKSAPAIAVGTSRVFVSIQGRIQLD